MASNSLLMMWLLQRPTLAEERTFRRHYNAFDLNNSMFVANFRLSKEATEALIEILRPHLTESPRFTAKEKVLVTLRFVANGSYQRSVANDLFLAISQKSVSRAINEVVDAINNYLLSEMVTFPQSAEDILDVKRGFMEKYGFPAVIGAIDCTHVAIVPPNDNPPFVVQSQYVNRKGYHSINVQLVCDHNLKILNVNARFPGSVHDAFIFKSSFLRQHLEMASQNCSHGWLLGDTGYPLEPWLMVPFMDPLPGPQERFNDVHKKAWNVIERCNGVLKNRFRCLLKHRVLHYAPSTAGKIINACVVLHNWCLQYNVEEPIDEEEDDNNDDDNSLPVQMLNPCSSHTTLALLDKAKRIRLQLANNL